MLLLALIALAAPAPALAQEGHEVIRDCAEDGDLDGDYSQEELDDAYDNMPSDIDQYSNCRQVIEAARERSDVGPGNAAGSGDIGSGVPGGSSSGPGPPGGPANDLEELEKRREQSQAGDGPQATVAGESGTFTTDAGADDMSLPLIIALIVAALGAVAGALYLLRDQLPAGIGSRLPGPLKRDTQV